MAMYQEVEIMGAYFPGWLLAAIAGIVLSAVSKVVLAKLGLHRVLIAPMLVYCCLAFLWSSVFWLWIIRS